MSMLEKLYLFAETKKRNNNKIKLSINFIVKAIN